MTVKIMCTLEKIIYQLKQQKKTQKDLTDHLGLTKNTFTNWKAGASESYKKYIGQIAEFLNVSTDYLLGIDTASPSEGEAQNTNTIKIAGRDGSFLERKLTDDQLDLIKKMIDQLPDAEQL